MDPSPVCPPDHLHGGASHLPDGPPSGGGALFRALVEHAQDVIAVLDGDGTVRYVTPSVERVLGYPPGVVLGRDAAGLVEEGDLPVLAGACERIRRTPGGRRRVTLRGRHSDGSWRVLDAVLHNLLSDPAVRGIVFASRDVTARSRAEADRTEILKRAHAAERRARFLAEASELFAASLDPEATLRSLMRMVVPAVADSCIVYLLDASGEVSRLEPAHADPAKAELLREQLGRNPARLDSLIPPVARVLRSGEPEVVADVSDVSLQALPGDSEHVSVASAVGLRSLVVVPLSSRGRVLGAISYGSEERRYGPEDLEFAGELARRAAVAMDNARLHAEVRQAVRARDQVLQVVSHDLKNPLSAIVLMASALLDIPASATEASGARELVSAVLTAAGPLVLAQSPCEVGSLVAAAVAVHRPLAENRSVRLEWHVAEEVGAVMGEGQRILQVVCNLLGNAIKFTPPGGRITLRAEPDDGGVRFSVADTGCGIPAEHLPRLFERFWKGDSRSRAGLGLGLTIAREIVEAHGGRIWAESRPGNGSTFRFVLPGARPDGG